ncbi:MAG: hypothetical protein E7036_06595 [Opitutales bacterium]|nr:hypothetical protein [Opitutales bacterium]
MFALIFTLDEKKYGIDVENIVSVMPAFDVVKDDSCKLSFIGWRNYQNGRIPTFDLNYAINQKYVKHILGVRHIIFNATFADEKKPIALAIGGVESVSEFSEQAFSKTSDDTFCTAHNNEYGDVEIINIASLLKGALFDYE